MLYHILAVGDVVGEEGLRHLSRHLRSVKKMKDIAFTVPAGDADSAVESLRDYCEMVGAQELLVEKDVCKVSIVGAGMETHENVAAGMFEALADAGINIQMISSSEIRVSVLVDKKDGDRAVAAVHRHFFGA